MRIVAAFSLGLLMALVWTYGIPAASWEHVYEGNKLPDDPAMGDKVWKVFKTAGAETSEVCKITPAGELHITDPNNRVCFFMRDHGDLSHTTLEAKVKVLSQSGAEYTICLEIEDGADTTYLGLFPDRIKLAGGEAHNVDMKEYHVLRIVRDGKDVNVYVDGKKVIAGKVGGSSSDRHSITFGAGSTGGTGEHYWDYVAYTTAGAFSPEELSSATAAGVERRPESLVATWAAIKRVQ